MSQQGHHQQQVHVAATPGQDIASLLLPHEPDQPVALRPDPDTGGARVETGVGGRLQDDGKEDGGGGMEGFFVPVSAS